MSISLTREQLAIIGAVKNTSDNILIEALAGSGKTSTLKEIAPHLSGTVAIQAFNKAIAEELKTKIKGYNITIGTSHSFGLKALRAISAKPRVEGGKLSYMLKDNFKQYEKAIEKCSYLIRRIVSGAKNAGFGCSPTFAGDAFPLINELECWDELCQHFAYDLEYEGTGASMDYWDMLEICKELLVASNNNLGMIDFDDMIYLPLVHNVKPTAYDNMLIDEAQDISATRRELAFRSLATTGRLIAVGDANQAIYGFTGADVNSLNRIGTRSSAVRYPLTICWRCDDAILDEARQQVPDIRTAPAKVGRGEVSTILIDDLISTLEQVERCNNGDGLDAIEHDWPEPGDVILCRLNKPNVAMAMELIRRGQRVRIEGRDLGASLLSLVKKANSSYANNSLSTLASNLESYIEAECYKLASSNRQTAAAYLQDEGDAAQILIERTMVTGGQRYSDLERLVNNLFDDNIPSNQFITLSSIHKSKGREWPHVWILGRSDYMPFHRATQDWEQVQERNLIYVAVTRAEQQLTYISGVQSWLDGKRD